MRVRDSQSSARLTAAVAAGMVLCVASCRSVVEPMLPAGAEPLVAPPVYATWWAMTEACAGVSGSLDRIHWYVLPGATRVPYPGRPDVISYWTSAGNSIVLAGAEALNGGNVRHEMLHALLRVAGHPREAFLGRCAGVVDCWRGCIADAGPPSPIDRAVPIVKPDQLRLGLVIAPAAPSAQTDSGFFTVTVTAANPLDHAIVVSLPNSSNGILGRSFTYRLQGSLGGIGDNMNALDSSEVFFAAGETKRHVFDIRVGEKLGAGEVPPGEYSVGGSFGLVQPWANSQVVLVP